MESVFRSIAITGILGISLPLFASPKGILIRSKNPGGLQQGLSFSGNISTTTSLENLQIVQFQNESEKQNFIESLNSDEYEWEEKISLSADDTGMIPSESDYASDPLLANQWSIAPIEPASPGALAVDIDAFRAWEVTTGSGKVVIYVMDSGIDTRDPDLSGRVTSSFNAFNPALPANDDNGHGTHVTSIISAKGNNHYGIRGVVPGDIQIAAGKFLNGQNQGDSETALRVINWIKQDMQARRAQDPKVQFIGSNSWGGDQYSKFLEEGMQELTTYGYLPITSAGNHGGDNDSKNYFPCNFKLIANICVAASDRYDRRASYSGFGVESVHLFAPGDNIYAIVPGIQNGSTYQSKYETKKGTSQAVPHVAGVAALIWAANPELSPTQVREIIIRSVDLIPGAENQVLSGGRLNAYRAVLMATGQDPSQADRGFASNAANGGGGCILRTKTDTNGIYGFIVLIALGAVAIFLIRSPRRPWDSKSSS